MFIDRELEEAHTKDSLSYALAKKKYFQSGGLARRLTDTKVAGRNASVTTEIVFIDALSLFAAKLISMVPRLISTVALLSLWTTTLKP